MPASVEQGKRLPEDQRSPDAHAPGTDERSTGFPPVWLWLAFPLFVYPLSIGPAARIHRAFPRTRPVIEIIYEPLAAAAEHSQTAHRAMWWYVHTVWGWDL